MAGHLSSEAIGTILDHTADVIEGGNAYNSGTSYRGIPGTYPSDEGLRTGGEGSFTATGTPTTTVIANSAATADPLARWVKDDVPGFFLVDETQEAARRITSWDPSALEFTTDAFPAAASNGDTILIRQGFKRIPNQVDISQDVEGFPSGFDRFFDVTLEVGTPLEFYGAGTQTWQGELLIWLRLQHFGRVHDLKAAVAENLMFIASMVQRGANPDHRESSYTRAILPPEAGPDIEVDENKTVGTIRLPIVYRINRLFE